MSQAKPREAEIEQMEQNLKEHNDEVRARDKCLVCDLEVPEQSFETKFAAAGGALTGPFCGSNCYWEWMNDE